MRRLHFSIGLCLLLLASSPQSWGDPIQYLPVLGQASSAWNYDLWTSIQSPDRNVGGSFEAPVELHHDILAGTASPGQLPGTTEALVWLNTWFETPSGASFAAFASTSTMSYGAIAAGFAEVDYYAGIESDSPPPEPVTTIPVILVATGDGEGTGSYGYLSYLQITGYGANGRWNASGGIGAGGDSQFDLNVDLNLYPGQVYSVQARARCGAEAGQTTNVLSSACQAMVDPVFIFDQATFDAEMGANTFPLDEYFSLRYSPNMDISSVPEPSTLLLTGFGIAVLAPCLRRRRVLPPGPNA